MQEQFVAAVHTLSAPGSSGEQRKGAEAWLLSFNRSDEGWDAARQLLLGQQQPADVQLFSAQALKTRARLSIAAAADVRQRMQNELLQLLHACPGLALQPVRQVVLALAPLLLSQLDGLPQLISQMSQALQLHIVLLILETVAEEGASLQPFGPGSMEERGQALLAIKSQLQSHSPAVFSWLATVASQQPATPTTSTSSTAQLLGSPPQSQRSQEDQQAGRTATQLMDCFNAWVKLGGLHELGLGESQALINLALQHCQDINSPAFDSSCDVMAVVLDHCPPAWLTALHPSLLRLADLAGACAGAGQCRTAEALSKVFCAYACMAVNPGAPATAAPKSAQAERALMALAVLPQCPGPAAAALAAAAAAGAGQGPGAGGHGQQDDEPGDPVCWPALQAWTSLVDQQLQLDVGGYDYFDDADFFQEAGEAGAAARQRMQQQDDDDGEAQDRQHGNSNGQQGAPNADMAQQHATNGFMTAGELAEQQEHAASHLPSEMVAVYEQLYIQLLNNLVLWGRQHPARHSSTAASMLDSFTPTFMAALNDCLVAICTVVGPNRYLALLQLMIEQQQQQQQQPAQATAVAAAACHAVSAAGGDRLTANPPALHCLAGIMAHVACQAASPACPSSASTSQPSAAAPPSDAHLVAFCCAAAATGKAALLQLAASGSQAPAFLAAAVNKALAGLAHEDASLDVRTPAALAIKGLMAGALEAGCSVPSSCLQALVQALTRLGAHDAAAEQALVQALAAAVAGTSGGQQAQQEAEYEVLNTLTGPLHRQLCSLLSALQSSQHSWPALKPSCDEPLAGALRRYSLVLQHALQRIRAPAGPASSGQATPASGGGGTPLGSSPVTSHGVGPGQGARPLPGAAGAQGALQWMSAAFVQQLWPQMAALVLQHGAVGEWVQSLSRCVGTLLRLQASGLAGMLPELLDVLVACVKRASEGGQQAADTLALCMEQLHTDPQCLQLLQSTMDQVLAAPAVAALAELHAADQAPELSEAVLKVGTAYVRFLLLRVASQAPDTACATLGSLARIAAATCCANHKAASTAGMLCIGNIAALPGLQGAASCAGGHRAVQEVVQRASVLVTGVIGTLLCASPLSRVQKASAVLTSIAMLAARAPNQAQQQPASHAAELFNSWISAAGQAFQLPAAEVGMLCAQLTPALLQSLPSAVQQADGEAARQQELSARRAKKVLREFAEQHSRTQ